MGRIKKRKIVIVAIVLCAVFFLKWHNNPERKIFAMVEHNLEKYQEIAEQLINDEVKPNEVSVSGVEGVKIITGEHVLIDFYVTGFGLAPSSVYYGFYYSPEDLPMTYMDTAAELKECEPGVWKWQGGGDNKGIVKKIADGWYYYEASF